MRTAWLRLTAVGRNLRAEVAAVAAEQLLEPTRQPNERWWPRSPKQQCTPVHWLHLQLHRIGGLAFLRTRPRVHVGPKQFHLARAGAPVPEKSKRGEIQGQVPGRDSPLGRLDLAATFSSSLSTHHSHFMFVLSSFYLLKSFFPEWDIRFNIFSSS